jgi:hypothetical protein
MESEVGPSVRFGSVRFSWVLSCGHHVEYLPEFHVRLRGEPQADITDALRPLTVKTVRVDGELRTSQLNHLN